MRRVSKRQGLAVTLVALLLAFGLVACGGDDSDSTGTDAAAQQQAGSASAGDDAQSGDSQSSDDASGDSGNGDTSSGDSGSGDSGSGANGFAPKQHDDSGGGSAQFKVKGGDNSVQEFGEEADGEELDAAAAALHNFLDARAAGNWAAACEYMSTSIVESFEQLAAQAKQVEDTDCASVIGQLISPDAKKSMEEEAAKADVGSLRIEGERAFVIYTGLGGTVLAMPMANEDGDWKVASLAGTPLS